MRKSKNGLLKSITSSRSAVIVIGPSAISALLRKICIAIIKNRRARKRREEKRREGKRREEKGREGKRREEKGREGKRREEKGREEK